MQSLIREHKTTPSVTDIPEVNVDNKLNMNESIEQLIAHNRIFCRENTMAAI